MDKKLAFYLPHAKNYITLGKSALIMCCLHPLIENRSVITTPVTKITDKGFETANTIYRVILGD